MFALFYDVLVSRRDRLHTESLWPTIQPSTLRLELLLATIQTASQRSRAAAQMPFHLPSSSSSSQHNAQQMPLGAASGVLQAAQTLGSFRAPTGNLNNAITGRPPPAPAPAPPAAAAAAGPYTPTASMSSSHQEGQSAPPSSFGLQQPNSSASSSAASEAMNHPQQFETPRRSRHPDELHIPSGSTTLASQRSALSPRDHAPRTGLEQATSESSLYQNAGQLPGSLQPGRPAVMSTNTAPTISQTQEQYSTPPRTSMLSLSHSYPRSSPAAAAFDGQGYGNDQGHFSSSTNQKYTPQNAQRSVSNTPLGLADIRPRADSGLSDGLLGGNPYSYDGANAIPTNSNYLAPWAIYAFDWCKWPAQNHDAGKVAVGSYLEDGHNFVSFSLPCS